MVFSSAFLGFVSLLAVANAQGVGTNTAENHPQLTTQKCTRSGCTNVQTSVTLDSNWRWTHNNGGSTNCYTGNAWDNSFCPNPAACAAACSIDGADYAGTYGITTNGNSINLKFVTRGPYSTNIGSRVYLMANDNAYQMFKLKNQEFTFDVDTSQLPCGLNGALYFIAMDADGGKAKYAGNKAGAKYGTGYCDAQCPRDIKWINGEANILNWTPSATDPNAGVGQYGTCCAEMDIWEANSISQAYTPHPCTSNGQTRCTGTQCGAASNSRFGGYCDPDGGDYASYRLGAKSYYGPGKTVNSNQKMTVVTQFKTADNTANGALTEIRRLYVQNGKIIQNSKINVPGISATADSITDATINSMKTAFGDVNDFAAKGGMNGMSRAMDNGMVLALSLWADHAAHMLWLDSNYPVAANPATPGVSRGTCATSSGVPDQLINSVPNASVTYSNIKFGDIGTTYTGTA